MSQASLLIALGAVVDTALQCISRASGVESDSVRMATSRADDAWHIILFPHSGMKEQVRKAKTTKDLPKDAVVFNVKNGCAKYVKNSNSCSLSSPLTAKSSETEVSVAVTGMTGEGVTNEKEMHDLIKNHLTTAFAELNTLIMEPRESRHVASVAWLRKWMRQDCVCPFAWRQEIETESGVLCAERMLSIPMGRNRGQAPAHYLYQYMALGGFETHAQAHHEHRRDIPKNPRYTARVLLMEAVKSPVPPHESQRKKKRSGKSDGNPSRAHHGLWEPLADFLSTLISSKSLPSEEMDKASLQTRMSSLREQFSRTEGINCPLSPDFCSYTRSAQ